MTYYVIEKPCPGCGGKGFHQIKAWDVRTFLTSEIDVNCGRCFATGWIEEYRHDGEDGSERPVEIPDPPDTPRTGCGHADIPLPFGTH